MEINLNHSMELLANRWYDAAEKGMDTSGLIQLCSDTEKTVLFLNGKLKETSTNKTKEIDNLCTALIQGFDKPDKSIMFAKWIAHNTGHAKETALTGAYPAIYHLFKAIGKVKGQVVDPTIDPSELGSPVDRTGIQFSSLHFIKSLEEGFPDVCNDFEKFIYSQIC